MNKEGYIRKCIRDIRFTISSSSSSSSSCLGIFSASISRCSYAVDPVSCIAPMPSYAPAPAGSCNPSSICSSIPE
jgi:hypothetical protein